MNDIIRQVFYKKLFSQHEPFYSIPIFSYLLFTNSTHRIRSAQLTPKYSQRDARAQLLIVAQRRSLHHLIDAFIETNATTAAVTKYIYVTTVARTLTHSIKPSSTQNTHVAAVTLKLCSIPAHVHSIM